MTLAIDLPGLPLTDTYCREEKFVRSPGIDQSLLYCQACCHGQLGVLIPPTELYGSNYFFRTSESETSRTGTGFFLAALDELAPGRKFNCVLDLGCNDLFLLSQMSGRAKHRVGIDPVWSGREAEREDKSILVFGQNFADVDLKALPAKPDLIVCRHTLEHIVDPKQVLEALISISADDALFLFEVPGFDGLVERMRFDQVFHQHAQYFTLASFLRLLELTGTKYLHHRFNYHHWGAMIVAFTRDDAGQAAPTPRRWELSEIQKRYTLFRDQMRTAGNVLKYYENGPLYGYGAGQMLPVLGYHMGTDFSGLTAILDDDPTKDGIGYLNLPVRVMASSHAKDLLDSTILLTAIDNVKPIMTRLLALRPRHIINPLNVV